MTYIVFFLISIICSLWFGEMKQGAIEFVWTGFTIIFFAIYVITTRKKKQPLYAPNTISILFLAIILPISISTRYSASIGYSFSFILRTLTAWCIFILLFSIEKKEKLLSFYATGLFYIGICVAVVSIIFRFLPNLTSTLPSMNLIFTNSGHNQGVNLLITLFPIAFHYAQSQHKKILRFIAYIVFPIAIILCFSRGATLIIGLYLLFTLLKKNSIKNKGIVYVLIFMYFSATALLFSTATLPITLRDRIATLPFGLSQITKSNLSEEARLANWTQAWKGFQTHPIIGTGPSTYILTSMRYHETPIDGAGLAHNWYIQTLSEVGILGMIPIGFLLVAVINTLMKTRKEYADKQKNVSWAAIGLIDSVFIALAYSLIEYNLDYFTLWILLWGTIGLLLYMPKQKMKHVSLSQGITICCFLLLTGYIGTNIYANRKLDTTDTADKRFILQPYDTNRIARYIEYKNSMNEPLTPKEKTTILTWHARNPDVIITLATAKNILSPEERKQFYSQAITLHPLSTYYYQSYLTFLYEEQQGKELQHVYSTFINRAYRVTHPNVEMEVFFRSDDLMIPYLTPELFSVFQGTATFPEVASKSLYFLGLSSFSSAPKMTETAWRLAKDIAPDWSSFHMELAAYYLHVEKKTGIAKQVLYDCLKREAPRDACQKEIDTFPNILFPGEQQMNIKMIPEFY